MGGMLIDDDTFLYLVAPLKAGVSLTCVLDCCHSGTILDLPYVFKADDENLDDPNMQPNPDFDFGKIMQVIKDHPVRCAAAAALTGMAFFAVGKDKEKTAKIGKILMGVAASDDP